MFVSQAEFARLACVSRSAVKQAINNGLITAITEQAGKVLINKTEGLAQYNANSRKQRSKAKAKPAQTTPAESELGALSWGQAKTAMPAPVPALKRPPTNRELQDFIQGLPEDQIPDLNDSRARREHYLAEKARLDALQGRKELLPADQVKAEAFALARALRDGLMRVADRLAPTLAATADARQVHHLLTEEIRVALRSLGDA